ncbi:MAG TPA: transglycosylase domain-containing protein, partial [Nitrospiraceae bacterium]|nr:transglycosylase domain-containing protein [Nitrospiraceae bacterium]
MEHKFSKREILELYLNQIYFGNGAYGIEAAAQEYFAKPASKLT